MKLIKSNIHNQQNLLQIYLRVAYSYEFNHELNDVFSNDNTPPATVMIIFFNKTFILNELNINTCENYNLSFDQFNNQIMINTYIKKLEQHPIVFVYIYKYIYIYIRKIGLTT